ncbi:EpsD family peptidyl-prolyl cis-trans isomerase [Rugamonas sp. CCM 8940]|nr:EpsD family peptidyl-prolyl cis-trans isomerase [Rugamonas sp. CCM 8940]
MVRIVPRPPGPATTQCNNIKGFILSHFTNANAVRPSRRTRPAARQRLLCAAMVLLAAAGLSACGDKEKKPGQALVNVNGEEITVLQLNEELQRSGASATQQEAASKQLLESLIDRQLLQIEAGREKLDRDPKVMQAIERAKALIVAQAYLQKRIGTVARPTKEEVEAYFAKNPTFFANRKMFGMQQVVFSGKEANEGFKGAVDGFKSLDEAAAWLDAHKVQFSRGQLARSTADLPPEMSSKLLAMPKGQLFLVREGERTIVSVISEVKDAPVALDQARAQIEQFLQNQKMKVATDAELARLRAAAKIEYLNKALAKTEPAAAAPAAAKPAASTGDANERGVAGLK